MRPVLLLAAVALPVGWVVLSIPVALGLPLEPFVLATLLFGMVVPALLLTARESGRAGVRTLVRTALGLPRPRRWLLVAALAVPVLTWPLARLLGATQPITTALLSGVAVELSTGLLLVNLWEEMVWMGFVQTRAMARWGEIRGSVVTAGLFAGIHLPLAFHGAEGASDVVGVVALMFVSSLLLRLIFARIWAWSGPGLLAIALMHATYNATGSLLQPEHDYLRLLVVGFLAVVLLLARRRHRAAATTSPSTATPTLTEIS
jgi:membrane protease YdiL (CAAX protease family)